MEKKKDKKRIIIVASILAFCICAVIIAIMLLNTGGSSVAEQLALGDRYLDEMDYEQALATYLAVIETEPKNAEAYLGAAEAYIGMDDTESAIAILETGYGETSDERIKEMLDELQVPPADDESDTGLGETDENEESSDAGAGDMDYDITMDSPLIEFLNAPFTTEYGFENIESAASAASHSGNLGVMSDETIVLDTGVEYYFFNGEMENEDWELYNATNVGYWYGEANDNGNRTSTFYHYYEEDLTDIYTFFADADQLTADSLPKIGGFSDYIAKYDCLTLEELIYSFNLPDETFVNGIKEGVGGNTVVSTPYGRVMISMTFDSMAIENYDCIKIRFEEGTDSPWTYIQIEQAIGGWEYEEHTMAIYANTAKHSYQMYLE